MIRKGVIMCGGWATRFLPVSKAVPKELLPLYDKPILQILVDDLIDNGVCEILFIIRNGKEEIAKYFSRDIAYENQIKENDKILEKLKNYDSAKFYFTYQNFQKGTGDALLQAKEWVGKDAFYLLNGDEILSNTPSIISQLRVIHKEVKCPIIALQKVREVDVEKYGIVSFENGENGYIKGIVEKPKFCDAPSNFANLGTYIFDHKIFDYIKVAEEMPITDAINLFCHDHRIYGFEIFGRRYDLGSPVGYVLANFDYLLHNKETSKYAIQYLKSLDIE